MALTDQVLMPGSDYQAICDATRNLTGKTATLKSGEISTELNSVTPLYEMWVLSKEGVAEGNMNIAAHFYTRTLDEEFTGIIFSLEDGSLRYIRPDGSNLLVAEAIRQIGENEHQYSWVSNPEYRVIVCKTPPTGALLTWLQANGVKQASYTAVETNHTCSGTVFDLQNSTITSEAPYDAMQKVTLDITIPEQEKTVSPTETSQTVTPDTHKVLSKVTVNPISSTYVGSGVARKSSSDLTADGATVNVPAGYYDNAASKTVDTAAPSTVVWSVDQTTGKVTCAETTYPGYIHGNNTYRRQYQLPTQAAKTVTPTEAEQTAVALGKYTTGDVVVAAVPTETKTANLSMVSGNQVISNTSGKYMTSVTIRKPQTFTPHNIKKGVSIGGITGTYGGGVDLPFTKLTTVSTDNGILSFSFTGYYNTIIAKRSDFDGILTAVFGNNLKASFSIGSSGGDLSTSGGFSYNQVGNKFNVTWNICESSGSVWYEGSYDIYGCENG